MPYDFTLPEPGLAEVRITAASPEVARYVAQVLRTWFASTEQRSYPAGDTATGTCLHLTVDTTRPPKPGLDHDPAQPRQLVDGAGQIWA